MKTVENNTQHHKDFILNQNNCPLCGRELHIEAEFQADRQIREKALCPDCELTARVKKHTIH